MLALGSPISEYATNPPFMIILGFMPKNCGVHTTISASLPGSSEPTWADIPCVMAGFMVILARYLFTRTLSLSPRSPASRPALRFILSAVCQFLVVTSPTLPIAWLSEDIMDMAPMSCRTSSAAMVSPRMRDSANERSSGTEGFRWWQTIIMSRCSASVFTVNGRVGLVEDGSMFGSPATLIMSGACPPPAPSVWYVWMVRPAMARMVSSTKPHSLSVSVCIATCVSVSSATRRAESMVAGVVPQSSCSFSPQAPAPTCSRSDSGRESLPLQRNPKLRGYSSAASIMRCMFHEPGVQVVAFVPSAGPVPPPIMVVVPLHMASTACCGEMKWMWVSMVPGVHIVCSPAITSVLDDTVISMPSMMWGLPAFPTPAMSPSFIPMSAFTMPSTGSMTMAFVISRSSESSLRTPLAWPIPSRALFPPPKTISSPCASRSRSISIIRSVSASRTLSPVVGPNSSAYRRRGISSVTATCTPSPRQGAGPRPSSGPAAR